MSIFFSHCMKFHHFCIKNIFVQLIEPLNSSSSARQDSCSCATLKNVLLLILVVFGFESAVLQQPNRKITMTTLFFRHHKIKSGSSANKTIIDHRYKTGPVGPSQPDPSYFNRNTVQLSAQEPVKLEAAQNGDSHADLSYKLLYFFLLHEKPNCIREEYRKLFGATCLITRRSLTIIN